VALVGHTESVIAQNETRAITIYGKGPGYPQSVYFGHKEPLNGIWFEKGIKGEFVLLKGEDRIPVARYFCVNESILSCKSIVRLLSLT
jgi:hypothetical protein